MILAESDDERARGARPSCARSSSRTSSGLFGAMSGPPVTVRLLDPPLHEFLPHPTDLREVEGSRREQTRRALEQLLDVSLGRPTRCSAPAGCRLGILYPEIYEMQVRASVRGGRPRAGTRPWR